MPPKSRKAAEREKKKYVEDKTFGLKNKKKSKKVQKYVQTVQQQAQQKVESSRKRSSGRGDRGSSSDPKGKKALLAARMAELQLMTQPVKEKVKRLNPEEEERRRKAEEEEQERIRIANLPVEDQIEVEREKLKTRTPVTLELFLAWKEKKAEERRKRREAEMQKGLSKAQIARGQGLTGRDLFQFNSNLFVDDEDADDQVYVGGDAEEYDDGDNVQEREESMEDGEQDGWVSRSLVQPDPSLFLDGEEPIEGGLNEAVGVGDESLFT